MVTPALPASEIDLLQITLGKHPARPGLAFLRAGWIPIRPNDLPFGRRKINRPFTRLIQIAVSGMSPAAMLNLLMQERNG
jgi:hypothetical protein